VSEAAACCNVDLSVVSRHLAQLREAGILEATRRGKQVFYSVRAAALADTLRTLADLLSGCVAGMCDAERKERDVR
jgi:ArsR family transcriptional regulator